MTERPHVAVLGAGSWGTALALLLASNGHEVHLWGRNEEHIRQLRKTRENSDYLPGVMLPETIEPTAWIEDALDSAEIVLAVTPSRSVRALCESITEAGTLRPEAVLVSCTKGIEHDTGLRMSEILMQHFLFNPVAVLSGPSHAEEVARQAPTAVVIGAADHGVAVRLQQAFNNRSFRTYTSDDVAGIELGGALKNIYAIAAGICDGLGLGDNTKAALVTRALAELSRLGARMGGNPATFQGLSGVGDLFVTCISQHSRNRKVGERLGRGETPEAIADSMRMVAEGVPTTRSAHQCAERLGVETPVAKQIYAILYEGKSPSDALLELMTRDPKPERELFSIAEMA